MTDVSDWEAEGGFIVPEKTDRELLEELLDRFGLKTSYRPDGFTIAAFDHSDKQIGYQGYYSLWTFDDEGNFVRYGVWE